MKRVLNFIFSLILLFGPAFKSPDVVSAQSGLQISGETDNRNSYSGGNIPKYEKFEITFQINNSIAPNFQLPYDPAPPAGVKPKQGITVDAIFTGPNGVTYNQPAFYYQAFDDQIKSSREWFYPTGNFSWKVRYAPQITGTWKYRLKATDASGTVQTSEKTFNVVNSSNKGFVRVSKNDPRYFEFDNGTYFPALGFNMNYDHIGWQNPVLDNEEHFKRNSQSGAQLIRIWLSQWGIFSSGWNQWRSATKPDQYVPFTGLNFEQHDAGSELSMQLNATDNVNPCMFLGSAHAPPAFKKGNSYRISIGYKSEGLTGPRTSGSYGFVAKLDAGNTCYNSGTGIVITPYAGNSGGAWKSLEGDFTASKDFHNLYLVTENAGAGYVFIDRVEVKEKLSSGGLGVNIISRPWMDHHYYMEQRNSYSFDKVLDLAKRYDIYLRPVILEKNEWITARINSLGEWITPPDSARSYGGPRSPTTKVRWLQRAWWRYLQARWGYSSNIHSWELFNEANPAAVNHFIATDEMGKYMRQFAPDNHLVSSSHWHSFPKDKFWANPDYPNVDFADVHKYITTSDPDYSDSALATYNISMLYGAKQPGGAGKPVIRGETGFGDSNNPEILKDMAGIWLHKYVWGGINHGGLIESYWSDNKHIYSLNKDGTYNFDHRPRYGSYYRFIKDVPLNNGKYADAAPIVSNSNLRAWGQKDTTNKRAHIWIQNIKHTWKNVIGGVSIPTQSGNVTIDGFSANGSYKLEWWDSYNGTVSSTTTVKADSSGKVTLSVSNLKSDVAARIGDYANIPSSTPVPPSSPTPTGTAKPGDANGDGKVDGLDYVIWLNNYNKSVTTGAAAGDFNASGKVDGLDYVIWLGNYGK